MNGTSVMTGARLPRRSSAPSGSRALAAALTALASDVLRGEPGALRRAHLRRRSPTPDQARLRALDPRAISSTTPRARAAPARASRTATRSAARRTSSACCSTRSPIGAPLARDRGERRRTTTRSSTPEHGRRAARRELLRRARRASRWTALKTAVANVADLLDRQLVPALRSRRRATACPRTSSARTGADRARAPRLQGDADRRPRRSPPRR